VASNLRQSVRGHSHIVNRSFPFSTILIGETWLLFDPTDYNDKEVGLKIPALSNFLSLRTVDRGQSMCKKEM
jgi:hypothetical protein